MTRPMTCDQFTDTLSDYLERDVDDATRAAMDAHARECADCGLLLADLRQLRIDAANLPELTPSRDLWSGIAERITTPVVDLNAGREVTVASNPRKAVRIRAWMGVAAAAALVAVTATITHEMTKRSLSSTVPERNVAAKPNTAPGARPDSATSGAAHPAAAQQVAAAPDSTPNAKRQTPSAARLSSVQAVSYTERALEQTYGDEIARLRNVVKERRAQLDTSTVAVLDKNLQIIDRAIADCRDALRKDPSSAYLVQSLSDALGTKVQLLRTAATLSPRA